MLRPLVLLSCFALAACSQTVGGYRQLAPSLAEPGADAVDTRGTYLDLIRRMQKQGAYYASLAHIDAFRQRHGDSPALRLLQADALRHTGQLDAAAALYDGLTRSDQAAAAWHGTGLIAAQRDQDASAEAALSRAAQLTPLDTAVLGDLGYARLRAGQLEQARAPLAQALELAPGDPRAVANLAVWALLRNDTATAERLMQQGKVSDSTRAEIQRQVAVLRQRHVPAAGVAARPSQDAPLRRAPAHADAVTALAQSSAERPDAGLPATMLERFGQPTPASESSP